MSDYISREETLKRLCEDVCNVSNCQCDEARCPEWFVIHDIPAADVWPVVRCHDCMYAPSGTDDGEDQGFALEWPYDEWPEDNPCPCKCEDGWYSHKPKPDFFARMGRGRKSE